MKKRLCSVVCLCLFLSLCGGLAVYVKANEKELIKANIKSIIRACQFIGIYPVCVYKNGSGNTTLTYAKSDFSSAKEYNLQSSSSRPDPIDYLKYVNLTYTVTHMEGVNSKHQKTYKNSFSSTCKLGASGVNMVELDKNCPVEIYFNGITLKSTLGEGSKTKNLDSPEKGGMSAYNVPDGLTQMNFNISVRWNKNGNAVCSFKGIPFNNVPKTEEKFDLVKPSEEQLSSKGINWYSASDGAPVISIMVGSRRWNLQELAYSVSDKSKTSKGIDARTWVVKGTTWMY